MGNKLKSFLLKFALPVLALFVIFIYNPLYGLAAFLLTMAFLIYRSRPSLFANLGKVSYTKGNMDDAVKWFKRAYYTGKAKDPTIVSYAYLLLKFGNIDESEEILNKVLSSRPEKDNELLTKSNLALVLWKRGRLEDATAMLEEVITGYRTSIVYGSLGCMLILKGDLERALQLNQEAYEYNNENTVIMDNMGLTYYLTGQLEKAAEIYEKLTAKNPTFPEAYYNYGRLLMDTNQTEKAAEMLEKALEHKLTFLSTITREDIEKKYEEARLKLEDGN